MTRLLVLGHSQTVPRHVYLPPSYAALWVEFLSFWLAHPLWKRRTLTSEVYASRLAGKLREHNTVKLSVWARPWWNCQDYLAILPFLNCRDAIVVIHGNSMSDSRPYHYSRVRRKLINLLPETYQNRFNADEACHAQAGTIRFPLGWYGSKKAQANLERLLGNLKRKGTKRIILILDDFVSDTFESQLPGSRRGMHAYNRMAGQVAQDYGVTVLHASASFEHDRSFYSEDGVHISERGHEKLAETLIEILLNGGQ